MNLGDLHTKLVKGNKFPAYVRIPAIIFSNWLFQGILYMDETEKLFKILLDLLLMFSLYFGFASYLASVPSLAVSVLLAHTINWIFNGQIFVLFKNLKLIRTELEHFRTYTNNLKTRMAREKSILCAAAFGSLSRGELKGSSDLDVRVVRRPGVINGIRACTFVFLERSRAFFSRFPLDIYVLDDFEDFSKLRRDEYPVTLHDPMGVLQKNYGDKNQNDQTKDFREVLNTVRSLKLYRLLSSAFPWSTYYGLLRDVMTDDTNTLLDVGCGDGKVISNIQLFQLDDKIARTYLIGLDVFRPYLIKAKAKKTYDDVILCDVCYPPVREKMADFVLCTYVIEHLEKKDGLNLIKRLLNIARKKIVLTTAVGWCHQEAYDNNLWQAHKSAWLPEEFRQEGFEVVGISGIQSMSSKACSYRRRTFSLRPIALLLTSMDVLSKVVTKYFPNLAFSMLCVREVRSDESSDSVSG